MTRLGARFDSRLRKMLPRRSYLFAKRRYDDARKVVGRNPGRGRMLPDFLIIGAAKSGTTTLYGALAEHPFVTPCTTTDPHFLKTKEVHFFDYSYYRGQDWYRSHFPLERDNEAFERQHGRRFLTGEASPSYISHLWAPARICNQVAGVKLIAVLRNPIDRAYSQFQMSRKEGVEPLESFEDAVDREEERLRPEIEQMSRSPHYNSWNFGCWSYLARSRYAEQLERWLTLFPREQLLVLKAEDLFEQPQRVLDAVHEFLILPEHRYANVPQLNPGAYDAPISAGTRARLGEYFRPHNDRLYELVGFDFGWDPETVAA